MTLKNGVSSLKTDDHQEMCDKTKNVIIMGVIIKGVYCIENYKCIFTN